MGVLNEKRCKTKAEIFSPEKIQNTGTRNTVAYYFKEDEPAELLLEPAGAAAVAAAALCGMKRAGADNET